MRSFHDGVNVAVSIGNVRDLALFQYDMNDIREPN